MASSSAPILSVSSQFYRTLLNAYPRRFRDEYGLEMSRVFHDLCRDAYRQRRVVGLLLLWVTTLVDLGITALEERLAPHGGPRNVIHRIGVGLAAGMVGGVVAGVGARLAMRGVSLAGGLPTGFSVEGTFVILAIGLILGLPFGLAFMLVRPLIPGDGLWKGLSYGVLLFVIFIAPPFLFYREGEALLATPLVTVSLFGPVALAYGLAVQFTALRLEGRAIAGERLAPAWARIAWFVVFAVLLELAVLGTMSILNHTHRIPMAIVRQLPDLNLRFTLVRDVNLWIVTLIATAYFGLSAAMFWARNRAPMARFAAFTLMLFGGALFNTGAGYYASLMHDVTLLQTAFNVLQVVSATLLVGLLYVFPDGRFTIPWTRLLAGMWVLWAVVWAAAAAWLPEPATLAILVVFLASGVIAQVQRYRQSESPEEKRRVRGAVLGFAGAIAGFALVALALLLAPDLRVSRVTGPSVTATFGPYMLPWLLIPLTLGWAMRRQKLWAL